MSNTARQPVIIVQGGQWGSEGKGMVAAAMCENMGIDFAVRTGAVNAGHTVYHKGKVYKMQQLPTGWTNPNTKLVIGAGAYINPNILMEELCIPEIENHRLVIDHRAGLHLGKHTLRSAESERHHLIGATGKGCSEAIVDKIKLRGNGGEIFVDWLKRNPNSGLHNINRADTEMILNNAYDEGASILLEGTQGQLLDLHLGPYPYTTHKQCGPANWLSEAGMSPNLKLEIAMVVRTYPIRVAGNSGPMPGEISWSELAGMINVRLKIAGMKPRVDGAAVVQWNNEIERMANSGRFHLPVVGDRPNRDFHRWTDQSRLEYKEAVSELHAAVVMELGGMDSPIMKELSKLFEFTTVTKKLRRVARLDMPTMKASVRQIRPDYIVLTFLNYIFPELWNETEIHAEARDYVDSLEMQLGCEIRYVTTGPETQHMIDMREYR